MLALRRDVKPLIKEPVAKIEPVVGKLETLSSFEEDKPKSRMDTVVDRLKSDMSSNKPVAQAKVETIQKFEIPKEEPKAQPKVEHKPIAVEKPKENVKTEKVQDFMAGLDSSFDESKQSEGDDRYGIII